MRIWADIFDASGNRLGSGPVTTITSATVNRMLDGAGQISFSVPDTDQNAKTLLTNERRFVLWVEDGAGIREMGRGIIRNLTSNYGDGGWVLNVSGLDTLNELQRVNVLFNKSYNNQALNTIVSDLVALATGWTVTCSVTTATSARFDGVSVLKALQSLCEQQGIHLRLGASGKTIEVGAFGTLSTLRVQNVQHLNADVTGVAPIESLRLSSSTEAVANKIYPIGAGQNVDSALTLRLSTRTTPYTINNATVNGRTVYYLQDATSISAIGEIVKVLEFKEQVSLGNNDTDEIRAANALYDWASAWLQRNSSAQDSYSVTVRNPRQTIRPGDKIRTIYKGRVETADGVYTYRDLDAELWVVEADERVDVDGITLRLTLSNVDKRETDTATLVVNQLERVNVVTRNVQPTFGHYTYGPEQVFMSNSVSGKVQLIITDAVSAIDRVYMRIRTQPFNSTVTTSAAGGDHRHKVASYDSGASASTERAYQVAADTSGFSSYVIQIKGPAFDWFTKDASGSHTHGMTYGIYKDSSRPAGMSITVNGTSVGTGLGTTGADLDTTIDITDAVKNKVGGFRAIHDVVITAATNPSQGEVLVSFDVNAYFLPRSLV